MKNRTITVSTTNTPSSIRYRSIRYKTHHQQSQSASRTINVTTQPVAMQIFKPSFKSQRSRLFSQKKPKYKVRTQLSIQDKESQQNVVKYKQSYLQTWGYLLNPKKDRINQKTKAKSSVRVCLPTLTENPNSQFTMLDHVSLPIQFIQKGIFQLKQQIPKPTKQLQIMRKQLQNLQQNVQKQLQQVKKNCLNFLNKFKKTLICDRIDNQQYKMKAKRMVKELVQQYQQIKIQIQCAKTPLLKLQDEIFRQRPFELEFNRQYEQQFPSQFF